ncbi:hypothetical protein BSKO_07505 [Bryopsis sp. KO-2023]|nr:hypothetical protein BSKO_07505 [Bryopsis sp. KO-2023]
MEEYLWIVVSGAILAFAASFGMGANDVANAFGTSVGAKSITQWQAVIIASFCEFGGAVIMGSHVTNTIRKGIADPKAFENDPEILMFGMLCVMAATGIWLILASYLELPVSSTHSVIGGIIGMAVTAHGLGAVKWFIFKGEFPYVEGVGAIIASLIVSPVVTGVSAVLIFKIIHFFVIEHEVTQSRRRALLAFPVLVGVTVFVGLFFILSKNGVKIEMGNGESKTLVEVLGGSWGTFGIALGAGFVVGVLVQFTFAPKLKARMERIVLDGSGVNGPLLGLGEGTENLESGPRTDEVLGRFGIKTVDVETTVMEDATLGQVHRASPDYDKATECAFSYLQVFTAMCVSFAHGANDVANSVGPLAAIYMLYSESTTAAKSNVPLWILALGGGGIVVGLAAYGHKLMTAVGVKIAKMSPSRGFSVELSVAAVIVVGSRCGLPLSTTQCVVGGVAAIGLFQNVKKGVNYRYLVNVLLGWPLTMVVVGLLTAFFFAEGIYAPSVTASKTIHRYQDGLASVTQDLSSRLPEPMGEKVGQEIDNLLESCEDTSIPQLELLDTVIQNVTSYMQQSCAK